MSVTPPTYSPSTASTAFRAPAPAMPMPSPTVYESSTPPEAYYLGTTVLTGAVPAGLPSYSPDKDVTAIREACHGMGTRNGKLIKVLVTKTSQQAQVLQVAYRQQRQKELIPLLKDESSGVYKLALTLLASGALSGDAYVLKQALKPQNRQFKLQILAELVISKNKEELALFRDYLLATKHLDLDNTVSGAITTENKTVQAIFTESLKHQLPAETLDLERDYATLKHYLAGNQDRIHIYPILLSRPLAYLNQLAERWCRQTFNQSLAESISLHFKSDSDSHDLFLYAIGAAETANDQVTSGFGIWRDAQRIEEAITKKNDLLLTIRLIRAHWDEERFRKVIAACDALRPGKAKLVERVGSATSGNLKTLLKEMIIHATS